MFKRTRIIAAIAFTVGLSVASQPAFAGCGRGSRHCPPSTSSSGGDNGGTPIPAPAAVGLFAAGAAGLFIGRRRRKNG